jgi:N-acetylneuraminate synthase
MEGPDHEFALEPDKLDEMVTAIRDTEAALGSGEKRVLEVERELYEKARRAIHAVEDIKTGEKLTEDNIQVLRPGEQDSGLHPKFYDELVGAAAAGDISRGEGIDWDDVNQS